MDPSARFNGTDFAAMADGEEGSGEGGTGANGGGCNSADNALDTRRLHRGLRMLLGVGGCNSIINFEKLCCVFLFRNCNKCLNDNLL